MTIHVGAGRGPGHLNRLPQSQGGAPSAPVAGDPIALAIRDATALNAVNGSGWTADVTFKGMATGGVLDMSGAKALSVAVTRTGFTTAGAATTFSETIQGSAALRSYAPNQTTQQNRASGSDVIATAVLRRRLYSGGVDQVTSATIPAGAYTVGGTPSNARTVSTPTNSSAYVVPDPIYGFLVPHHQVRTAAFRFEMVVVHAEARFGQQVACVEFRVRDVATGTDQGVSVKCGTPELSTLQTQGPKIECYGGTIPISSLAQGVKYEVYALIYPWVGAAAFDTRTIGSAYTATNYNGNQTGVRFICDKNGTYGDQVAYVKPGASGGTVGSSSTPFGSIASAAGALKAANNAKTGTDKRNNCGGSTIYLMETSLGAGGVHPGFGGSYGNEYPDHQAGSEAWTTITADPAATGVVKFTVDGQKGFDGLLKLALTSKFTLGRTAVGATGNPNDDILLDNGNGGAAVWFEGGAGASVTWPISAESSMLYRVNGHVYVTNLTSDANAFLCGRASIFMGNVVSRAQGGWVPTVFVGNRAVNGFSITDYNSSSDRWLVGWNEFFKQVQNNTEIRLTGGVNFTAFGFISNVVECTSGFSAILFGDGSDSNVTNFVSTHNTLIGGRYNTCYTTSGISTSGRIKEGDEAYDIAPFWNSKSDIFRTQEGGSDMNTRTGNWAWVMAVNRRGVVVQFGDNNGNTAYGAGQWIGEVQAPKSRSTATVNYVDDKSASGGGGNYRLTGSLNDAYGVVDAGLGVLRFDLDGNLRRQDGAGAAGAYERP